MHEKHRGLGFGIFLLMIGAIWLLSLADIVTMKTFFALLTLWPLILVAVGISIIFRNNRFVRAATWLAVLAAVVCYGYFGSPAGSPFMRWNFSFNENWSGERRTVTVDKKAETERAELDLKFGASRLNIDSSASGLLEADVVKDAVDYSQSFGSNDRTAKIQFAMNNFNVGMLRNASGMVSRFSLNKDVLWDISIETGAESDDIDLSGLKTERLVLKTGLSEINLKMGSYDTDLKIDAGASKIDITLPDDTGIKVRLDGGVNSTNIDGPGWTKDGDWHYSPGYNEKVHKITADIDMGVGNLTIR